MQTTAGRGDAVAPNEEIVYVTNYLSNYVWIANSGAYTIVGTQPLSVAFPPDGAYAYVANWCSNNVSVIATATNSVVATVPVEANPRGRHYSVTGAWSRMMKRLWSRGKG